MATLFVNADYPIVAAGQIMPEVSCDTNNGYIWIGCQNQASNALIRFNKSDHTYTAINYGYVTALVFDGTSLWVGNSQTRAVSKVDPLTGALLGGPYACPDPGHGAASPYMQVTHAAFDGTYCWMPASATVGLIRITVSDGSLLAFEQETHGLNSIATLYVGGKIWVLNPTTPAVITITSAGGITGLYAFGHIPKDMCTDGTYIYVTFTTAWMVKIRVSDGKFIKADGTATADYWAAVKAAQSAGTGIVTDGATYYIMGGAFVYRYMNDTMTYVMNMGLGTDDSPLSLLYDGVHLWVNNSLDSPSSISTATIGSPTPNLTAVTPGTGPHLSLTFDNPVGITGPTIGAASSGLGVTGVTAVSTTQIDLACAIRPDPPEGDATTATLVPPVGEADNLGPPVPTGVGATVT